MNNSRKYSSHYAPPPPVERVTTKRSPLACAYIAMITVSIFILSFVVGYLIATGG
jgi:hypothetical protein